MNQEIYERDEFDKIKTVVDAACQNETTMNEIRLSTVGSNPSASVTVSAHMLRQFLKAPNSRSEK